MNDRHYLDDILVQLRKLKAQADRAIAQVDDDGFFATLDPEANSIALLMKHIAGNMKSRWTDFLTTDGEKPDRDRDAEFIVAGQDSRAHVMALWEDGWQRAIGGISALAPSDLDRTVHVRGEAHTVVEALHRQLVHYSAHIGQIVLLAKHYAGAGWRTLSIPRGKSKDFEVAKSGSLYHVDPTPPGSRRPQ